MSAKNHRNINWLTQKTSTQSPPRITGSENPPNSGILRPMRVAAIQMTSTPDKSANLAEAARLLAQAVDRGAELIAFPENFSLLTDDRKQFLKESETLKGLTTQTLQEWAAENDV